MNYNQIATTLGQKLHRVLTPVEQRLVETLAPHWEAEKPVSVLRAMHMVEGQSPSTVHRKIQMLRAKGLLTLEHYDEDPRVKHVLPTVKLLAITAAVTKELAC